MKINHVLTAAAFGILCLSANGASARIMLTDAQLDTLTAGAEASVLTTAYGTGSYALSQTQAATIATPNTAVGSGVGTAVGTDSAGSSINVWVPGGMVTTHQSDYSASHTTTVSGATVGINTSSSAGAGFVATIP